MKNFLKYSVWGVLFILGINFLTWFFYGKEIALLEGGNIEDITFSFQKPDILILFTGEVDDEYQFRYSDYNTETFEKLEEKLNSLGIVTIIDERPYPPDIHYKSDSEIFENLNSKVLAYNVLIDSKFPLLIEVHKEMWVPGFSTYASSLSLWFFGWHQILGTGGGIS